MRDLEIRGAGNLLGVEQSGNMSAVGYDMYCKLLNEAVKSIKGIASEESYETNIDLCIDAFIPDRYIANEYQKFDIYKRIAEITNDEEYDDMYYELMDRFGNPPKLVENLMNIASLKALAHKAYITEIKENDRYYKISMYQKAKVDPTRIPELVEKYKGRLTFRPEKEPFFTYTPGKSSKGKTINSLDVCRDLVNDMLDIIVN